MKTIIGLGNPQEKYGNPRHNAGRNAAFTFAKKEKLKNWEESSDGLSLMLKGVIGKTSIILVLPQTFMNKSGTAIKALNIKPAEALLVHDDADLPLGRIKFSFGKRAAGHKGVESALRAFKTRDVWRLRIGVQKKKRIPAEKLVLMKLSSKEQKELEQVFLKTHKAILSFLQEGPEKAMSKFNT